MRRTLSSRPVRKNAFSKLAQSIGPDRRRRSPRRGPVGLKRKGRGKGLRVAPRPEPERTLEDLPLLSGGTRGPLSLKPSWEEKLDDPLRRAFVSFRQGAFSDATLQKWWGLLADGVRWEKPRVGQNMLPRSAAWLTTDGCTCEYKYGATAWPYRPMERWFLDLTDEVCRACGVRERPNSCNANFYDNGGESVGWHADDEPLFEGVKRDTLIISLSLGESRTFELCPNDDPEDVTSIVLRNGDICTMEGMLQRHYKHRVPREPRVRKPRINLTWRWVVAHDAGCKAAGKSPSVVSGVPVVEATGADEEERRAKKAQQLAASRAARGVREAPARTEVLDAPLSSEELAKRKRRAERFGSSKDTVDSSLAASAACPTVGRLDMTSPVVIDTEDDEQVAKRRKRAEKFGGSTAPRHDENVPQSVQVAESEEAERKRRRAERFGNAGGTSGGASHGAAAAAAPKIAEDEGGERRKIREERFAPEVSRTSTTSEHELRKQQRAKRFGPEQGAAPAHTKASSTILATPSSSVIERAVPVSTSCVDSSSKLDAVGPTSPKASSELSEHEKRKLRAERWKST